MLWGAEKPIIGILFLIIFYLLLLLLFFATMLLECHDFAVIQTSNCSTPLGADGYDLWF